MGLGRVEFLFLEDVVKKELANASYIGTPPVTVLGTEMVVLFEKDGKVANPGPLIVIPEIQVYNEHEARLDAMRYLSVSLNGSKHPPYVVARHDDMLTGIYKVRMENGSLYVDPIDKHAIHIKPRETLFRLEPDTARWIDTCRRIYAQRLAKH